MIFQKIIQALSKKIIQHKYGIFREVIFKKNLFEFFIIYRIYLNEYNNSPLFLIENYYYIIVNY